MEGVLSTYEGGNCASESLTELPQGHIILKFKDLNSILCLTNIRLPILLISWFLELRKDLTTEYGMLRFVKMIHLRFNIYQERSLSLFLAILLFAFFWFFPFMLATITMKMTSLDLNW